LVVHYFLPAESSAVKGNFGFYVLKVTGENTSNFYILKNKISKPMSKKQKQNEDQIKLAIPLS